MSEIRVDKLKGEDGSGVVELTTGVTIPSGKIIAGAGGINVSGVITAASFAGAIAGNATGLTGTPNITVGSVAASSATISGNLSVGGTITYQDVTNIDSVGIVTAQQGIQILANGLDVTGFSTFKTGVSVTGVVTATSFAGNLAGNVTGDLTGEVNSATFDTVVGGVVVTGVATATDFNATSDTTVKDNIQVIEGALASIGGINGVTFTWKDTGKDSAGVTAQNLEEVLPNLVSNGDLKSVNYNGLVGYLVQAVKELTARVEALEAE